MTLKMAKDNYNHNGEPGEENISDGICNELDDINEDEVLDIEQIVEQCSNEYTDLNKTLDELDTWMTNIEHQNDSLYSKIEELLQSNKQIRQEIQQEKGQQETLKGLNSDQTPDQSEDLEK